MKKFFGVCFAMLVFFIGIAQTEKFDIATFSPPSGWQRSDSNGVLIFHDYKTKNNLTSFCQIVLFPSRASKNNASTNFKDEWNLRVAQPTGSKVKPTTQTESSEGWTLVTGFGNITQSGISYMKMLINATGYGRTMSVMVNTAGSDHAAAIEKFFNDFNLDSKAALALNQSPGQSTTQASAMNGSTAFSDYVFIAPQGWRVQNNRDHFSMSQNAPPGETCLILLIPPQTLSGNLEADAKSVFDQMYPGWSYRFSGEKKYDLIKGYTSQGLEYCMMQASMNKLSADGSRYDGFEDGMAMVIKAGNKVGIISARHNTAMMAHDQCRDKYETWLRFLNSITIKNAIASTAVQEPASKRIVGVWKLKSNGPAIGDYVFAANGNYQFIGGLGSSNTSKDSRYEYLHITSYAFQGDGAYTINGNQLKLMKRGEQPEQLRIRFEKINHGGTGWNDRIHLLKRDPTIQKEYEVTYEKEPPSR